MINFSLIKMQHARWNVKLSHVLIEQNDCLNVGLDQIIFDHQNCDLGKWLYSEGLVKLGSLVSIQQLEKVHRQLHGLGRQIVEAQKAGNISNAEKLVTELQSVNSELAKLIDQVEHDMKTLPKS